MNLESYLAALDERARAMRANRLILFSGMGADRRLLGSIHVPGVEVVTPDHLPPRPQETLSDYAARVAAEHGIGPTDFVGGASFGGMLAAEISRRVPVAGLVLLGSTLRPASLPRAYRWIERLGRFIPDFVTGIRGWGPFVRRRFAPLTPEAERTIVEMARSCPACDLRAVARMIVTWEGMTDCACPVLSVHGREDRIIPLRCAEPGVVLDSAGHAFTLTHATEISRAIEQFIASTAPARDVTAP